MSVAEVDSTISELVAKTENLEIPDFLPSLGTNHTVEITIWNNTHTELQLVLHRTLEGSFDVKPPFVIGSFGSKKNMGLFRVQDIAGRTGAKGEVHYSAPDRRKTYTFCFGVSRNGDKTVDCSPGKNETKRSPYVVAAPYERNGQLVVTYTILPRRRVYVPIAKSEDDIDTSGLSSEAED